MVFAVLLLLSPALRAISASASLPDAKAWQQLIETDWLAFEESVVASNVVAILPCDDAAGACDGVKDGGAGFHTELQDQPWWQVDLGGATTGRARDHLEPLRMRRALRQASDWLVRGWTGLADRLPA